MTETAADAQMALEELSESVDMVHGLEVSVSSVDISFEENAILEEIENAPSSCSDPLPKSEMQISIPVKGPEKRRETA